MRSLTRLSLLCYEPSSQLYGQLLSKNACFRPTQARSPPPSTVTVDVFIPTACTKGFQFCVNFKSNNIDKPFKSSPLSWRFPERIISLGLEMIGATIRWFSMVLATPTMQWVGKFFRRARKCLCNINRITLLSIQKTKDAVAFPAPSNLVCNFRRRWSIYEELCKRMPAELITHTYQALS